MRKETRSRWTSDPRGLPKEVTTITGRILTEHGLVIPRDGVLLYPDIHRVDSKTGKEIEGSGTLLVNTGETGEYWFVPLFPQKTGLPLVVTRALCAVQDRISNWSGWTEGFSPKGETE